MASTPRFKVYNGSKEYVAACKHAEDAAALVALYGEGAEIRDQWHRKVLWAEGSENIPAGESFDTVAATVYRRCGGPLPSATKSRPTRQDFEGAHAAGGHDTIPREGCPDCHRR